MNSNNLIPILQAFKLFWKNYANFKGTSDLGEYRNNVVISIQNY